MKNSFVIAHINSAIRKSTRVIFSLSPEVDPYKGAMQIREEKTELKGASLNIQVRQECNRKESELSQGATSEESCFSKQKERRGPAGVAADVTPKRGPRTAATSQFGNDPKRLFRRLRLKSSDENWFWRKLEIMNALINQHAILGAAESNVDYYITREASPILESNWRRLPYRHCRFKDAVWRLAESLNKVHNLHRPCPEDPLMVT
ncbi:unnamed protein product [Nesidiocoris tenuis]|uniref:Uncharacterized protein n=1 Tax=Nesidiocoris tenuis TaxID=355587 RepID=A0A6H5HN49_9HEMI|nr:unnamed protein product [Nesidiocoris tenuis]